MIAKKRKLPRTIRMDASDVNIFEQAAEPGEWSVTGTFMFVDEMPDTMPRKRKLAFASGWLSVESFGWSSLVQVSHVDQDDYETSIRAVAGHLFKDFGAPDMMAALEAAGEVVEEAIALCDGQDAGTILAVQRDADLKGIAERVRVVNKTESMHAPVWSIADD